MDRVVIGLKSGFRLWILGLSLNAANRPLWTWNKARTTYGVDVVMTTGGFTERCLHRTQTSAVNGAKMSRQCYLAE